MRKEYAIYKGLQKPLIYKGFKGKYVYWALGSVACGVLLGGILSAAAGVVAGAVAMAIILCLGILCTSQQQKKGLHRKNKQRGVLIHQTNLNGYGKENSI